MTRNYTTISTKKTTKKVLNYLEGTGQSHDGYIRDLLEKTEGKTFEQLLKEANEEIK